MTYSPTPQSTKIPKDDDLAVPTREVPQVRDNYSFSDVIANGVNPQVWEMIGALGSGQTIAQSGGNLVMTTGTTARQETIIRSLKSWRDALTLRWAALLSQRIANQSFIVELVDVIGDNLAYTITSATQIQVTIPNNPFTAANIGQQVQIGNFIGTGTWLTGAATIASIAGNVVTFTVAGFAAGSGTCSIWGWNFHQCLYSSTSATAVTVNSQRRGWPKGGLAASINTSASGHVGIIHVEDGVFEFCDMPRAGSGGMSVSSRAGWFGDAPTNEVDLKIQIRILNGATAPASTTTFTVGFVSVENYTPEQVAITSVRAQSTNAALPVQIATAAPIVISGASYTPYNLTAAATTNAAVMRSSAGSLYEFSCFNPGAATIFVKLYNKATAPTVGTDVPILTIPVPAGAEVCREFGSTGKRFSAGIGIAVTTNAPATDTTALAAAGAQISATMGG